MQSPVPAGAPDDGRLVGRHDERARIVRFVDSLVSGPATLVIRGEAGIGKSTLWQFGLRAARERGYPVRAIRLGADDRHRPAGALVELFGADTGAATADSLVRHASSLPAFERGRLVLEVLRGLSAESPVLVGVDDQLWLDPDSANGLRFALDRLIDERVGMFLTSAADGADDPVVVEPRHARFLELGPMDLDDLREVVARSATTATRPELARIHELSNGNPTSAIRILLSRRRDRHGAGGRSDAAVRFAHQLPELSELSEDCLLVIRTLAVAGPSPVGLVAAASAVDDFDRAARVAVDAGVVQISDDLTMRFTQTLHADAVRAAMNPLDTCKVHGRLAQLVSAPEPAARHLAAATLLPDENVAAHLERVAESCALRGASDAAADLMAHSIRLTPAVSANSAARRAVREIMHRAAAGETARAIALADRALATLGPGRPRAEVLTLRVFLDFGDSERFLRRALDDVPSDPGFRARTLDLLGWQLGLYRGRLVEGIAATTEALDLSRGLGDAETACIAGSTLAAELTLHGQPADDLFDQAVTAAKSLRPFPLGRWPRVFRARAWMWAGHLAEARREFLHMQRDAVELGSEFQRPYRLCDLANVDVVAGDLDSATGRAERGIDAARDAGNEHAIIWLAYPLGLAAALQGGSDRARRAAQLLVDWGESNDEPPRHTMADEILGNLAATEGDWRLALEHFSTMTRRLDEMGYAHPGARPALPRAIEAAAMVGDGALCRRLTDQLRAQAQTMPVPLVELHLVAARGQVALVEGHRDRAIELLQEAAAGFDALGFRFESGRTGLALARAQLRCGQRGLARASAEQSRAVFADAGAPHWLAEADELMLRAGGTSGSGEALTRTEAQISSLVAAGRMNREIAAELFISVSTVEAHLTRIYRKLGLRGRTDLTNWMRSTVDVAAAPPG